MTQSSLPSSMTAEISRVSKIIFKMLTTCSCYFMDMYERFFFLTVSTTILIDRDL